MEYKIIKVHIFDDAEKELNELAKDGWDLTTVQREIDGDRFFLKRIASVVKPVISKVEVKPIKGDDTKGKAPSIRKTASKK